MFLPVTAIVFVLLTQALASPLSESLSVTGLLGRDTLISSGCSTTGTASCHNTLLSPGGLLLQTQFRDTDPPTGPTDSWTIHGICDTTFMENCDPSRAYTGISSLLSENGASDTLSFMDTHWVDINGNNEQFWEHEWSTHGTCMSTLEPSCLPSGSVRGAEAVAFFETVVKLFQTLPTFTWLSDAGITPSSSETFTLSQLTSALKSASVSTPLYLCSFLGCYALTRLFIGALNQISWYFNLKGSVIDGTFVAVDAPESGSCPSSGIRYPPKSGSH
ncbi:ribonuclease T2-like protein [Cyathus striatus]|nr:ribonuclease T2-like protein [Cyathus striatus]